MLLICQGSQLLPHLLPHPLPPWWPPPHPLSRSLQPLTHLVRHSEVCGIVCNTVKSPTAPLHVSKSYSFNSWRLASPYLSLLQHCWVEHPTLCLLLMWSAPSKHAPLSLLVVCTCTHALSVLACPLIVICPGMWHNSAGVCGSAGVELAAPAPLNLRW